MTQNLTGF